MKAPAPLSRSLLVFGCLAAFTACAAVTPDDRYLAARTEFMIAYGAATAGLPAPAEDSERLAGYPLYPYLQAARLKRELGANPVAADLDARIAEFLAQQGEALAARELRRAWLLSLAERGVWSAFLANYSEGTSDATLRCDALAARLALGRADTPAAMATELWLSAEKSPAACDAPFAWLRTQPAWTPELIEKRARLVLAAGSNAAYARSLAALLPAARAAPLLQWAALIESPQKEVDALIAQPARGVEREALLDGWTRFARKDPDTAETRWDALLAARRLDAAAASPFARALALGLAWSRRPTALESFKRIAPADVDALAAEWWARAAMWAGDWPQLARVIATMPDALRTQQRWRYWAARAAAAQGNAGAEAPLALLADEDGWYPALASAQLHRPYAPHPQPIALNAAAQGQIAALPGIVRAHELFLAALRAPASAEWTQATEALDPALRTQSVALAARWSWYDQAVGTASRQLVFADYELLYPRPYDVAVRVGAAQSGVSEDLIYGVLRQESLYRADAVSKANALGLMQLIRETAARTAKRLQRPAPTGDALFDPATNIALGAGHLRELIDRFGGQVPLAVAGYNAGPNAAARWLPPEPVDMDVWIENIPFNETRTYVQRVLWHALVFGWRRSGKAQKLDGWLAPASAAAKTAESEAP
ncbi:MAG: transglycosylase SLT domain-containing protein [Nevskia sp.]